MLDSTQQEMFERAISTKEHLFNAGYAGTGKTFVAVEIYNHFKKEGLSIAAITPTNKAAQVLRSRGIQAQTLHSFCYKTRIKRGEGGKIISYEFKHRMDFDDFNESDIPDLIIIDEASMIGEDLYNDIARFDCPQVYFGDPFQLPPVKKQQYFGDVMLPDLELTEIHRTAADNPVLKFAEAVRKLKEPWPEEYGFPIIGMHSPDGMKLLDNPEIQWICWTNKTRNSINKIIRNKKKFTGLLQIGERIMCLDNKKGFYNGGFYTLTKIRFDGDNYWECEVMTEDNKFREVLISKKIFEVAMFGEEKSVRYPKKALNFDYSYCITAHKAQGSEWESIAVVDERWMMARMEPLFSDKWFYTAITRTRDNLYIVRK